MHADGGLVGRGGALRACCRRCTLHAHLCPRLLPRIAVNRMCLHAQLPQLSRQFRSGVTPYGLYQSSGPTLCMGSRCIAHLGSDTLTSEHLSRQGAMLSSSTLQLLSTLEDAGVIVLLTCTAVPGGRGAGLPVENGVVGMLPAMARRVKKRSIAT